MPPYVWIDDAAAAECAACCRRFGLLTRRRHHCRRCGRVFCDACSPARLGLPGAPPDDHGARLCVACAEHLRRAHADAIGGTGNALRATDTTVSLGADRLLHVAAAAGRCGPACDGEMDACPACSVSMAAWSPLRAQRHVHACVSSSGQVSGDRYTVFVFEASDAGEETVPETSAQSCTEEGDSPHSSAGTSARECSICYEAYEAGQAVAILNCLCRFHETCIADWFARGHACPYHP